MEKYQRDRQYPDFDESLRPFWPQAADGREGGWGAGSELIRIHDHLREEARLLLEAVDDHIAGREPIATARSILHELSRGRSYSAVGSLCSGFCTLVTLHHSIEDRSVFPGLARAEPGLAEVLRRLMVEHEVIHEIVVLVQAAIDAAEAERSKAIDLKRLAEHLDERLRSHLSYEESQIAGALDRWG